MISLIKLALPLLYFLFALPTVEAGKQRETLEPTSSPSLAPTESSPSPTLSPTASDLGDTDPDPSNTDPPNTSPETSNVSSLELPNMNLFFSVPRQADMDLDVLKSDWQGFLQTIIQIAVGVTVESWTEWNADITYTATSGQGLLRASGEFAVPDMSRRSLQKRTPPQEDFERELAAYFLVWGVDDTWEFFVSRGHPITSLSVQMEDKTYSPRKTEPQGLQTLLEQSEEDEKRNAWVAGLVMAIVVFIVIGVVLVLYLQRRGRHTPKVDMASSPRTQVASDPASPKDPRGEDHSDPEQHGSSNPYIDRLVPSNYIITGAIQSEDMSSVPGFSESSFLYDASRLDQVIHSAKDYELPYDVPQNVFSDLTMDVKESMDKDEEEEDNILGKTELGYVSQDEQTRFSNEPEAAAETQQEFPDDGPLNETLDSSFDAFSEIDQFQSPDKNESVGNNDQGGTDVDPTSGLYSRSLFDEEKKEDEGDGDTSIA